MTDEYEDPDVLTSKQFAALNNDKRLMILKILREYRRLSQDNPDSDPYYARTLKGALYKRGIDITEQMIGQHLKKLEEAGLVEKDEMYLAYERGNEHLVNAYELKENAFEDLFLEVNFLLDELVSFMDLYDDNQEYYDDGRCVLTILNGRDKGLTFWIDEDEEVIIGRKSHYDEDDFESFAILLDNSYKTVSAIDKPHLKIYNKKGTWYAIDEASTNGTWISDNEIKRKAEKLSNDSFIRLSKGPGSAIIYCHYE